jgi:hypothetical protein
LVVGLALGWWLDRRQSLAKIVEYQLAEKRELELKRAEEKLRDLEMQLFAAKAVNEYGVPTPRSQRTAEQNKKYDRLLLDHLRAAEELEALRLQNKQ